ncbi:hypothetical protein C8Q70DRAFT_1011193 [Cubamyces menziesii]|nr:hypothetical protein C8Q70DRAFT_1011193 [Cubamyces menziesii]
MSLSTCDSGSHRDCVSDNSTASETGTSDQPPAWHDAIQGKVHIYGSDVDDYLRTFVPSQTPCNVSPPSIKLVEDWNPHKGKEKEVCDSLVKILTGIVKDFPEDRRPSFCNSHGVMFPFPFSQWADRHHPARPDLIVSFPGDRLPATMDTPGLSCVSMTLEAKGVADKDPFAASASGDTNDRAEQLVQHAVDARNLMFAHGFLATYTLGVYGSNIRIARFDHTCIVASPLLDLRTAEGLGSIQEFFWRFVHPWEGGSGAVVGCDTTSRKLTSADEMWLRTELADEADEMLGGVNLREGRVVQVYDDDEPDEPKTFLLFKLLDVNTRLFSRATMVWLSIEYTRTAGASSGRRDTDSPAVLCVTKESWRQWDSTPEQKFYQRLAETIPAEEWHGLPKLLHGGDLGVRDVKRWDATRSRKSWSGDDDILAGISGSSAPSRFSDTTWEDVPHPTHQTYSLRACGIYNAECMERSHVRLVVNTLGRPLSRFKSTKELVMAMRDAIHGHRLATTYGGVLHRDVSSGNIMIVDRPIPEYPDCKGVLHDFDFSSMSTTPPSDNATWDDNSKKLKARTGTYYFIAHDLIDPNAVTTVHDVCHDLESYYWVLLWIVLRHTNCVGGYTCAELFRLGDDLQAAVSKHDWVGRLRLSFTIIGNPPLTALLQDFKRLVFHSLKDPEFGEPVPLTYETVLRVFDQAIAREDWPSDDKAIPFRPDGSSETDCVLPVSVHAAAVSTPTSKASDRKHKKRKRDHDAEERKSGAASESNLLDAASQYSGASMVAKRPKHGDSQLARAGWVGPISMSAYRRPRY